MPDIAFDRIASSVKGSYVLIVCLEEDRMIAVGKRGPIMFRAGYYAYAGSAMGGLKARVARHLRCEKKRHWHIDYLLEAAVIVDVLAIESPERFECEIARILADTCEVIGGFGSSDCRCAGHLLYRETPVTETILETLNTLFTQPVRRVTGWKSERE